jgi:hypothetical protein
VALQLELTQVAGLEEAGDRVVSILRHQHTAWTGDLLQSRRQIGRVAHRGVIHPQIVADPAHDHGPGVQTDAHLQSEATLLLQLARQLRDGILDAESGVHGALGAILVRDRRAEQRHDAVAAVLVDGALEAMHLGRDGLKAAIDDPVHFFGIHPLRERGEAGDVGEQDGDLPPLAFQR